MVIQGQKAEARKKIELNGKMMSKEMEKKRNQNRMKVTCQKSCWNKSRVDKIDRAERYVKEVFVLWWATEGRQ